MLLRFLWVSLQVLDICTMEMESQVLNALERLIPPENMQKMYREYAEGFEYSRESIQKQITQRTMALLAHGTGSMSKDIILVALALDTSGQVNRTLYEDLTKDPSVVVRFCNHLVRFDENLGVFQFCHGTVFEFFKGYKQATYNYRIAKLCLSHLHSLKLPRQPPDATWYSPGSLEPILQKYPFLPFISSKWAASIKRSLELDVKTGLQESHSDILNLLEMLFEEEANLRLAFQIHLISLGKDLPAGVCHEHIVSYFGLFKLFDILRERNWFDSEKVDDHELRPIHWAVRNEIDFDDAVLTMEKLLEFGVDINVQDKSGRTPLYYAAYYGNWAVAQVLVGNNAELNLVNKKGESALVAACRKHHEKIVLDLIAAKADVKIRSSFGTALQTISLIGCCTCAEAILQCNGKSRIIESNGPLGTSLHAAAFHGHSILIKLLCSKQMNFHITHGTYGSAITAASTGWHTGLDPAPFLEIIKELIKRGVKVNDQSGMVGPALVAAAYQGCPELVRLLLENGAKVRKAKGPMGTAYEAAHNRGNEKIKKILLESDAKAADYGRLITSETQDRQQIQQKIFTATVVASSMGTIDSLISRFEKFFENEIEKGDTAFLRKSAKLGRDCLQDMVKLATQSRNNPDTFTRGRHSGVRSRLRDLMSYLCCVNAVWSIVQTVSKARPAGGIFLPMHQETYTFDKDSLNEHIPQVIDRLTQAAVKILESAISNEDKNRKESLKGDSDRAVTKPIANSWIEALNNLISFPGFGESMLDIVLQRRANEFRGHMTNPDLSPEERNKKAEALAQVGIELILVAVERGHEFRRLFFVLSRLWIRAVDDAQDLGPEGLSLINTVIHIFFERFSRATMVRDRINLEVCAQAGIELMKAAALSRRLVILDKFSEEWETQWELAFRRNMEYTMQGVIEQRWKEYQECLKDGKHDEALGLSLTSMAVLRTAIKHRSYQTASAVQRFIELGFSSTAAALSKARLEQIRVQDLGVIFDSLSSLYATAEETQTNRLCIMTTSILDILGNISDDKHLELSRVVNQRIEEDDRIISPPEREKKLVQVSRIILHFLEAALGNEEKNTTILLALKEVALGNLARAYPNFVKKDELSGYRVAARYLKSAGQLL